MNPHLIECVECGEQLLPEEPSPPPPAAKLKTGAARALLPPAAPVPIGQQSAAEKIRKRSRRELWQGLEKGAVLFSVFASLSISAVMALRELTSEATPQPPALPPLEQSADDAPPFSPEAILQRAAGLEAAVVAWSEGTPQPAPEQETLAAHLLALCERASKAATEHHQTELWSARRDLETVEESPSLQELEVPVAVRDAIRRLIRALYAAR